MINCANPIVYMKERYRLCQQQSSCKMCPMRKTAGGCTPLGVQTKADIQKLQAWSDNH